MKKNDYILIGAFFAILLFFSIGSIIKKDVELSQQENRILTQLPELEAEALMTGDFSKEYETYLSEQFLFRNYYITLHTLSERFLLKNEVNGIYYGKDGYMFEKQKRSEAAINENIDYIKEFTKEYKGQLQEDIHLLLVPDKSEVLKDYLPSSFPYVEDESEIQKIYEACEGTAGIYVTEAFKKNSGKQLFYRTDHHWTADGCMLAYYQWKEQTRQQSPMQESGKKEILTENFRGTLDSKTNFSPKKDSIWHYKPDGETEGSRYTIIYDGNRKSNTYLDLEKLKTKDGYGVFFGGNYGMVEIETETGNDKTLLVIKDSFANAFVPVLLEDYERIIMIDLRYYNQSVKKLFDETNIAEVLILYSMNEFSKNSLYKLIG